MKQMHEQAARWYIEICHSGRGWIAQAVPWLCCRGQTHPAIWFCLHFHGEGTRSSILKGLCMVCSGFCLKQWVSWEFSNSVQGGGFQGGCVVRCFVGSIPLCPAVGGHRREPYSLRSMSMRLFFSCSVFSQPWARKQEASLGWKACVHLENFAPLRWIWDVATTVDFLSGAASFCVCTCHC